MTSKWLICKCGFKTHNLETLERHFWWYHRGIPRPEPAPAMQTDREKGSSEE